MKNNKIKIKMRNMLYFLTLLAFTCGQTTNVERCQVHTGELPYHTYIDGCIDPPCRLHQGDDAFVNMIFRAPRTMISMRTLAMAFVPFGPVTIPVPYPLGEDANTCNFLTNSFCPVLKEEVLMYTLNMHIEEFFPVGTAANLEFRIVDENELPVTCIRISFQILEPRNQEIAPKKEIIQ